MEEKYQEGIKVGIASQQKELDNLRYALATCAQTPNRAEYFYENAKMQNEKVYPVEQQGKFIVERFPDGRSSITLQKGGCNY